jgi:exodeoxyribonuclease VII small subunit
MSNKPDKKPDFETALAELEGLVSRLESGDLSLDQSLACFKRGVELTRHCQSVLDEAQKTVELLATNADGQADIEASD